MKQKKRQGNSAILRISGLGSLLWNKKYNFVFLKLNIAENETQFSFKISLSSIWKFRYSNSLVLIEN